MRILFLTHYFPPEVNAPASRTYENAKRWIRRGHKVTVITCAPNHPKGILYPGYANRWFQWESIDGIRVLRVKTYLSANKGVGKRILNYLSYMVSSACFSLLAGKVDLVISTSPQFFCGAAGYLVSRFKRKPWVLEIRDLFPESIVAVEALRNRHIIRLLEGVEMFLYRHADHVVVLTQAFKRHIKASEIPEKNISIVTNGADLEQFHPNIKNNGFRKSHGLVDKCVLSYVGTHGMAHGLGTVLKAADRLRHRDDIFFLLVGDGAEREQLLARREAMGLDNVLMLPQQPKEKIPEIIAASDGCMVLLKDTPQFRKVIPSKIFEAMAMQRPIILGVKGESHAIIEKGSCGLSIEPENDEELAAAAMRLANDGELGQQLGDNGRQLIESHYSRDLLAKHYIGILEIVFRI
jgi:glycosyltransferase involved in cell wall biosynthesis